MKKKSHPSKETNELIESRPLRSRRALLLTLGGAAGATALATVFGGQAKAGNRKADFQDLDSNARDTSDHFGGTSDSD